MRVLFFILFVNQVFGQPSLIMKDYVVYNYWANIQMINWLNAVPDSIWKAEVISSFSSLEATSHHIFNAEYGWQTTLNEKPWERLEIPETTTDALALWQSVSLQFSKRAITRLEENTDGETLLGDRVASYAAIILHVCNHSTYHRGQLITMGRQLGLTNPPRTDFIYFDGLPEDEKSMFWMQIQRE